MHTPRTEPADALAAAPPMGWNSWDCYGASITEQQFKDCARRLAERLLPFGWQYAVIDIQWFQPDPPQSRYPASDDLCIDEYGRYLPAPNRFPSASGGRGFAPLAEFAHSLGLKFGVHMLRGVPRLAVERGLPILGTDVSAADVADHSRGCAWHENTWGMDMSRPGAQEYYDSVARLYAAWGVDYVKADDMCPPRDRDEIAGLSAALARCGRPIVLSLSGITPVEEADLVKEHAHLWRISNDLWDVWAEHDPGQDWTATVKGQFDLCARWARHAGPGHWPDPDMLPLGRICLKGQQGPERDSRLTPDEQRTVITLWSISRSPLMFGGDPLSLDPFTLSLLTNQEVLAVNQRGARPRQLWRRDHRIAWASEAPEGGKHLALFNVGDEGPAPIEVEAADLGLSGRCSVRDLWAGEDLPDCEGRFSATVEGHGAGLYRLAPR
ncbi:MAG: hypothetical protein AMK73_02350 [Planctomycetes bacterium SM23_32]|nr:MAG: hypothetical protein AMK73_02350 [Planctomycetes bacterium SM23_32]